MKFSILAILRICGIICEDTGWFRPYTLMMHQPDGGSSKDVEARETNEDDYFILTTERGKTYHAYKLPDKPGRSSVNRSGELQGMSYDYSEYTYNKKEWGCDSALFGYGECDAFAANKFEVYCQDTTNQKSVVKICACCHKQLMNDEEGENEKLNEELYPSKVAPISRVFVPREPADAEEFVVDTLSGGTMKWKVAGGCANILAEGGAWGGLTNRNYGSSLFSDTSTLSKALGVMDQNRHIMNTVSDGDSRGHSHSTSASYAGSAPGTNSYQSTWPRTREILEKEYPPFKDFFKEIETDHECKISDGHIDLPLVENGDKKISFEQHVDKPFFGKCVKRGILSLGNPLDSDKDRKIMRITDREYGRWVDVVIDHGTFIEMDLVYSGAINGRYTHEIRNADGVYSIIMDYGDVSN